MNINWIYCKDELPKEFDSIFSKYYNTEAWNQLMWKKESKRLLVLSKLENGNIIINIAVTHDGRWFYDQNNNVVETIAWVDIEIPKIN